jgi:hypothetical protein
MFDYFEPYIIDEISQTRSRILILFDSWGSKHEKISLTKPRVIYCLLPFPKTIRNYLRKSWLLRPR